MELIAGYKNTEVGIIPDDWEVKTIADISKPVRGGSPRPAGDPKFFNGDFIPWLTVAALTNIPESQLYVKETASKLTKVGANYSRTLEIGTLIIANSGFSLGISKILNIKCCANDGIAAMLDFDDNLDKEFVTYYLNTLTEKLRKVIAIGNDQPNLNKERIGKIVIPVPPKAEQTAIATALSDADALINGLEKLIAKKRNIKQGAMQKLLKPQEGWEVKKLGDFLDYEQPTNYLVSDTEYNDNNQTPVLTAGKTFILGYTNEEHGIFKNLPVIIFDDFTTAIKYVDFPFKAKSSAMKMLIPKNNKVNLRFIYEIMLQIKYQVADHKRHWIGEFSKLEITVPPTAEEQNLIAIILSDMDKEINALETKLEKYKRVKLGMMQNLLTGKIRLV